MSQISPNIIRSITRYTRFVVFSKLLLGLASLGLILMVILIPLLSSENAEIRIAFDSVESRDNSMPLMVNPVFQGVDKKDQPYTITAETALQKQEGLIVMEAIEADMFVNEKNWLALKANGGTLDDVKNKLTLLGNVEMFHDAGYEVRTERADINMKNNDVTGPEEIYAQGLLGNLRSDRFRIEQNGDRLYFVDNVKMVIKQ